VVTIVNTLKNITSHSTVFNSVPPELKGFLDAQTNSGGTRVETVTYTIAPVNKLQTTTTTVLTYPNFFIKWPDY